MKTRIWSASLYLSLISLSTAVDWPQWFGAERDGVWRETGIIKEFPDGGPPLVWKQSIGSGYAGPAVANGRVYVFDRVHHPTADLPDNAFKRGAIPGVERLHCLEAASGEEIWSHQYEVEYTVSYASGPRCTPLVDDGHVYILGAEGHLQCLSANEGKVVWQKNFAKDFDVKAPNWGFAASPLIVGNQLVCLARGEGTTVVSYDKKTGEERWRALSAKEPGYCPPALIHYAGKDVLLIWHPESINGLNPSDGKVLWTIPWKIRSGLCVPTPRQDGNKLFLTSFYNGATMLELSDNIEKTPEILWQTERESERRTEHLNSIMGTPVFADGHLYGGCSYGQFRCLRASDGERLWESFEPIIGKSERWANVFVTPHEDRYFLFNELGQLIIANLGTSGYEEISRANLIEPNGRDLKRRPIVWSHPAYANQCIFVRNDTEIRCFQLAESEGGGSANDSDAHPDSTDWEPLFGKGYANAVAPPSVWMTDNDGVLTAAQDQAIWTKKTYDNFIVDLEFKTAPGTNSGVVVYCSDTKDWIPNSLEVQIADNYAEQWANADKTWQCAAIFGHLAASESRVKKPGEWNRMTITCQDHQVMVALNGKVVTEMDMTKWTSAKTNPDGSKIPPWLSRPVAELETKGKIGLQGKHAGAPIYYRHIRIKEL